MDQFDRAQKRRSRSTTGVVEAAIIGARYPKWQERPLPIVVKTDAVAVNRDTLLQWFEGKVAKWGIPDDVVFVDELPYTATGRRQGGPRRDHASGAQGRAHREYRGRGRAWGFPCAHILH